MNKEMPKDMNLIENVVSVLRGRENELEGQLQKTIIDLCINR